MWRCDPCLRFTAIARVYGAGECPSRDSLPPLLAAFAAPCSEEEDFAALADAIYEATSQEFVELGVQAPKGAPISSAHSAAACSFLRLGSRAASSAARNPNVNAGPIVPPAPG